MSGVDVRTGLLMSAVVSHIEEDEEVAGEASAGNFSWYAEEESITLAEDDAAGPLMWLTALRKADAAHIARHDPRRVRAEAAARRETVALVRRDAEASGWRGFHLAVLRQLAAPYD